MQVRAAMAADAPAIAAIYAPHVERGVASFELAAPDVGEMARRMAASGDLYPWLVAEEDGGVIAYAYAAPFATREAYRWAVETTIYVAEAGQERGVGRRLYGVLLDSLHRQGFTQAIGRISLPNGPSTALHEALGFTAAGLHRAIGWKAGRWIDVGLWQRALCNPGDSPAEPRSFRDATAEALPSRLREGLGEGMSSTPVSEQPLP